MDLNRVIKDMEPSASGITTSELGRIIPRKCDAFGPDPWLEHATLHPFRHVEIHRAHRARASGDTTGLPVPAPPPPESVTGGDARQTHRLRSGARAMKASTPQLPHPRRAVPVLRLTCRRLCFPTWSTHGNTCRRPVRSSAQLRHGPYMFGPGPGWEHSHAPIPTHTI